MQYGHLVCATSRNIGNEIQYVAAARLLPPTDTSLDQEKLHVFSAPAPVSVIMNAWFMIAPCWPPSRSVHPIFTGFHVTPSARGLVAEHADYLKAYQPIGTRDQGTADFLRSLDVEAEVTYCATLTLPRREREPANGRVVIVDAAEIAVPKSIYRGSARLTHAVAFVKDATKLQYARELLEFYRDNARLIVTTRLHCALPCIAMGIPVVFFGDPSDYRTRIVSDVGGRVYSQRLHSKVASRGLPGRVIDQVDWDPKPIDVSKFRDRYIEAVRRRLPTAEATAGAARRIG